MATNSCSESQKVQFKGVTVCLPEGTTPCTWQSNGTCTSSGDTSTMGVPIRTNSKCESMTDGLVYGWMCVAVASSDPWPCTQRQTVAFLGYNFCVDGVACKSSQFGNCPGTGAYPLNNQFYTQSPGKCMPTTSGTSTTYQCILESTIVPTTTTSSRTTIAVPTATIAVPSTTATVPTTTAAMPTTMSSTLTPGPVTIASQPKANGEADTSLTVGVAVGTGGGLVLAAIVVALFLRRRGAPRTAAPSTLQVEDPKQPWSLATNTDENASDLSPRGHATRGSQGPTKKSVTASSASLDASQYVPIGTSNHRQHTVSSNRSDSIELNVRDLELYKLPSRDLTVGRVLAAGGYGQVLLGKLTSIDGVKSVAVKRILPHKKHDRLYVAKFIDEVKLMAKLECPHVVRFEGVVYSRPNDITLVMEFMDGGDLRHYLERTKKHREVDFPWDRKLTCAKTIAQALVYLHSLDPAVIHRDLKSHNVLLNSAFEFKLTDFGISREYEDDETLTMNLGTRRWTAPEVLQSGRYDTSADIFSLGVILTELSSHNLPRPAAGTYLPAFGPDAPSWFVQLGTQCMSFDPTKRPPARQVVYTIANELRNSEMHHV